MGTVRELLNRLRWDARAAADGVVLAVRTREGGIEELEEVDFATIVDILPGGMTLADGAFLPYHRVVTVRRGEEVLWRGSRS